ncbi:MAG: hypothetical protein JNK82_07575 [Myxococcaceae bacterium]|nr:hypothetical protein [Myxococcaceae bacterium]
MTALLVVFTLLGQADAPLTPPPPPPQVEPEPLQVPPPPLPQQDDGNPPPVRYDPGDVGSEDTGEPPPHASAYVEDPDAPSMGVRILGATGFAAIAVGALTVGFHFVGQCRTGFAGGPDCVLAGFAVTALGFGGIIAGAFGGHRLFGGKSNLGWTFLGAGAGLGVGLIGFYVGAVVTQPRNIEAFLPALLVSLVGAVGGALTLEIGHLLMVRELKRGVRLAAAPMMVPGGGGLSLAGTF